MDENDILKSDPAGLPCWACKTAIGGGDNYCRHCGKGQGAHLPWQYKWWGLFVLALGLGPFSLVFLWRSPLLSRGAKLVYTAFILLLTYIALDQLRGIWRAYQALLGGAQFY